MANAKTAAAPRLRVVEKEEGAKSRGFPPAVSREDAERLMREKLEMCGISAGMARKAGLHALTGKDIKQRPVRPHGAGILIPYFDAAGEQTDDWRLRYLPAPELPKDADGKEQRYASPRGAMPRAYFPPGVEWGEVAKDPSIPIIVTEGEFKAMCGAERGLAVLALGGVHSYRSAARHVEFLPELEAIDWRRRQVAVLYDSDLIDNSDVHAAQLAFAEQLTKRGALPRLGFFPPAGADKVGLDDFVVAVEKMGGKASEAVAEVVERAMPYRLAERLWQMNDEVAFLRNPTAYVSLDTSEESWPVLRELAALKQHYENRKVTVPHTVQKGNKASLVLKEEETDALWRAWPLRREVAGLTFAPGEDRYSNGKLNIWLGWGADGKLEPKRNTKVEAKWKELLGYVFPQPDRRWWFEAYIAYKVQHPKSKAHHAVVLYSKEEGVGKDMVCEAISSIYGRHAAKMTEDQLLSEFNSWLAGKMFLYATEITGSDGYAHVDKVKGYITSVQDSINEKNQPRYTIDNLANFVFLTNRENAFKMGPSDRRFAFHSVTVRKSVPTYTACADVLRAEIAPAALLHYFLNFDTKDYTPRSHAPAWDKRNAYRAGLSAHEEWICDAADALAMRDPKDPTKDGLAGFLGPRVKGAGTMELATVEEMFRWYSQQNPEHASLKKSTFGRALRQHFKMACEGGQVWLPGLAGRAVVILRNPEKWVTADGKTVAAQWARQQQSKPPKYAQGVRP